MQSVSPKKAPKNGARSEKNIAWAFEIEVQIEVPEKSVSRRKKQNSCKLEKGQLPGAPTCVTAVLVAVHEV